MQPSIAVSRERLAGGPMLVGLALAFGALLAAVLPTKAEYARSLDRPSDSRSLPYLEALTRASGHDASIKLLYVRRLQGLGRYEIALDALGPEPAGGFDAETANLHFDLVLERARAQALGSRARKTAFAEVAQELARLRSVPETAPRLHELADVALQLEEPHLGAEFLLAVESLASPEARAPLLAEAGRWFRAAHDEPRAAQSFDQAASLATDPSTAGAYAGSAIDAVQAQDRPDAAADLAASYAARYPADDTLVGRAVLLATAANRAGAARDLGRHLLAMHPDDDAYLQAQARRELAAADPRGALPLLSNLVARHPEDAHWREVEARVAEWAGDPSRALVDWLWLLGRGADIQAPSALP